ncbi:MAG: VWA domain-containing protein [Archangium sp.]|nr:VWA domain-containing protein [Archangium sp.]
MSVERFNALKARLDALLAGTPPDLGVIDRARLFFSREERAVELAELRALDTELDRAGVHTVADARLLRELGAAKGRIGELASGLAARSAKAIDEFEAALSEGERLVALEKITAVHRDALTRDFARLGRIVKVAAVFSAATLTFEVFPTANPAVVHTDAPKSPQLAIAEFLAQRALGEVENTARKRRDLDLAYELLLRMAAETKGDRERSRKLRIQVGAARERVRAAPAVRSLDELVRHVRHTARKDPSTAWRSMRSLYERAVEAGDSGLAEVAAAALQSMPREGSLKDAVERSGGLRSVGWNERTRRELAEELAAGGKAGVEDKLAAELSKLAFDLDDDRRRAMELAMGCARFFDVEDALAEEIVEAETATTRPIQRRVPYPTQLMTYETTNSLDHLNHFVLDRPGALVLDLASGRQMVRAYVEIEPPPKQKKARKTAVRVYVMDASGSMHGSRARFRDALLISELNAIRVKARVGLPFDPLYFSFFNDTPSELVRVDSGDEASKQIEALFENSPAEGQTDIVLALEAAFDSIGKARGEDPYLARATVVLVTDGEDGVDLQRIKKHQRPYEGLDIALSFISLGEENPDLRSLVISQRDEGGRAFYHHVSDAEIQLARTDFDSAWRTLLPADVPVTTDVLERLLPHLEALEAIAQRRDVKAPEPETPQFDALFPEHPTTALAAGGKLERVVDILQAVAEAVALAPADGRRHEAALLLMHLLGVYGIPLVRYLEWAQVSDERLTKAIARIRLVC